MFRNKYKDEYKGIPSVTGDKIVDTYVLDEKTGNLVFAGKDNIYEYIQSFKNSTDINIILKQLEVGDDSRLHAKKGMYLDVSNLPKNATELHKSSIYARTQYNNLPQELRDKFGSFDEFINADGNFVRNVLDDYNNQLSLSNNDSTVDSNESEV